MPGSECGDRPLSEFELRSEQAADWIQRHCRVPEGMHVGKPVVLHPEQLEILRGIYDSPTRRAIISFGRKNGKTSLSAMLLLLHLCGPEAKPNSQLYSAAQSREQAGILFGLAAKMVRMNPDLSEYVTVRDTAKQLYYAELGTLYRALSAEASTAYGLSPAFTVHDELGQVKGPRSELYDALETAAGAQEAPLSVIISTQAPTDGDLLSVLIDDAKKGEDPRTKLFLWEADADADPFEEETWRQANPMYGITLNPDEVREQAERARRMPSMEASFRNLILNQRIDQTSPLIPRAVWVACGGEPDRDVLHDSPVFAGLDLSARNDLTALVYGAMDAQRRWHVWAEFFAPRRGLIDRARRDRVPYDVWAEQGWLTLTPGATVEYEMVAERLLQLRDDTNLTAIAFDRWRMDVLEKEVQRLGVDLKRAPDGPLVPHGQGFRDMSPAIDLLEGALVSGHVLHGGNPVLMWCAANAVATTDPAGNRKLDKAKARGRIDGLVAMAMMMGVSVASLNESKPSVYEERGLLEL